MADKKDKIIDKKRIAVCGGTLGRENKSYVRGQVVDVGITDITKAEGIWDLLTGLFQGEESHVTPFLDFSLAPVRKPILRIEVYDSKEECIYRSEPVIADEDGFFSHTISKKITPGKYIFEVSLEGLDSYRQFSKDLAFLNAKRDSKLSKANVLGRGRLRILPEDYSNYVITSDIDQTYLATDLHSKGGKLAALFETAEQKRALAGMPELYRRLRKDLDDSPLIFISASPHFFRRTLFATVKKHNIEFESIHLKYLEGTIKGVLDKVMGTTFNPSDLLSGGFRSALLRTKKFLGASYQSLFDQMAYKLSILLQARIYLPTGAKEILLGDNTESDYMIFTLYQLILMQDWEGDELEEYLYKLNFQGRDAITRDNARYIRSLAEENWKIHGKVNPVSLAIINITDYGPGEKEMRTQVTLSLPGGGIRAEKTLKGKPAFYGTEGAIGMAILLHHHGFLEFESIFQVTLEMVGDWHEGKVIDDKYLIKRTKSLTVTGEAEETKKIVEEVLVRAMSDIK
ncbi:phosphatase domain-containing protein [Leptospira sp. GIMC2001]|uniref:phosphatase domain-containing protein n=1 Tax=Leptospira sp. GIMC2001 TaxID=1513297 RepID=UPI0023490155|nr:phosphatase domain-containing protein [Leptospira sp. GIMC2001]WCL47835.1 hypothetical protein O4O04_10885 [Leptospira sp. GIMC2001]